MLYNITGLVLLSEEVVIKMSRVASLALFVVTGIISWLAYIGIATWLEITDPQFIGTAVISSVLVHEIGHWMFMEYYGIRAHIFFAIIFGGAVPEDTEKYDDLPWIKKSTILLAGPGGNVVVVVVGVLLYLIEVIDGDQLGRLVNINGGLISLNLIPFGILDGGRFAKLLFDSVPERYDDRYLATITIVSTLMIIVSGYVTGNYYLPTAAMIFIGANKLSKNDDQFGSYDSRAMSLGQCRGAMYVYLTLLTIGIVLEALSMAWHI